MPGFPAYRVGDDGTVQSCWSRRGRRHTVEAYLSDRWREAILWDDARGRPTLILCAGNGVRKTARVHRLVAEAFCPNPRGYWLVRHLDDDPLNNRASNLVWGTPKENAADRTRNGNSQLGKPGRPQPKGAASPYAKLTSAEVIEILGSKENGASIGRRLGVSKSTISKIRRGLAYQAVAA